MFGNYSGVDEEANNVFVPRWWEIAWGTLEGVAGESPTAAKTSEDSAFSLYEDGDAAK